MASTRATANPNVGDAEYAALLHTWFATRTVECWTSLFRDTELVSQKNKVRPHTLIDMAKLLGEQEKRAAKEAAKETCPTCHKKFVTLSRHKCKKRPRTEAAGEPVRG